MSIQLIRDMNTSTANSARYGWNYGHSSAENSAFGSRVSCCEYNEATPFWFYFLID